MADIDLNNFRLVKTGNADNERDYTNAILHAIVDYANDIQSQITDGSAGGDPSQGQVVVAQQDPNFPNARILQVQEGVLSLDDGGPGSTIAIGVVDGGIGAQQLAATGVAADTYGDATNVPQITVDEDGRITDVVLIPITGSSGVQSVVAGDSIDVDNTDPLNPIVSVKTGVLVDTDNLQITDSWTTPNFIVVTTTGLVNVLNPTGVATASTFEFQITSALTAGGITASTEGRRLTLFNSPTSTANVTLTNRAVGGGTGNWFYIGVSGGTDQLVLKPGYGAELVWHDYGSGESGWQIVSVNTGGGSISFANPSAQVGLTAVNGSATTAMRSDVAPALDVGISPTWAGTHTFSNLITGNGGFQGGSGTDVVSGHDLVAVNKDTGGESVYARNHIINVAGGLYLRDQGVSSIYDCFRMYADHTAQIHNLVFDVGNETTYPLTFMSVDAATGAVTFPHTSFGTTFTDTAIQFTGGSLAGSAIDTSLVTCECRGISTAEYSYPAAGTTWQLWVYPTPTTGVFTLDVRVRGFGNTIPGSGDSITASAQPSLTADGIHFTNTGSISTWTGSPIHKGDMVTAKPTVNSAGVQWWILYMPVRRVL